MNDDRRLAGLRELLPATGAGIYLDTATRGPASSEVAAAMREADDWELTVGRVWEGRDDDVTQRHDEARAVLGALVGADPAAITLTPGLESAATLARSVLGDDVELTRLVHPHTGELSWPARAGRPVVVDLSMAAGAIPIRVDELDADGFILACDRWLLGPESTAALWLADPDRAAPGMAMARTAVLGVARSVGWLEMYVGLEWIYERTADLAQRLLHALQEAEGVEVLTQADSLAAIVTFRLSGWPADQAAEELSRRVHSLVRVLPELDAIRASVGWFNTEAELDRFVVAVAELARHTPETLPRRPNLIVIPPE